MNTRIDIKGLARFETGEDGASISLIAEDASGETSLRARWHRWLKTESGRAVCAKWKEWITAQVAKYEWDIDPDDAKSPTTHGLRGTGVLTRWAEGYDVDQISDDIGMSRQMVDHYMRFKINGPSC